MTYYFQIAIAREVSGLSLVVLRGKPDEENSRVTGDPEDEI